MILVRVPGWHRDASGGRLVPGAGESASPGRYSSRMPASSRRRALLLICAVAVAVATNYTIQGPVLGFIRAEFALSSADAGAIATAFFAGAAITMLAGGAIADRIGTRPAVTLGFLLVAVGEPRHRPAGTHLPGPARLARRGRSRLRASASPPAPRTRGRSSTIAVATWPRACTVPRSCSGQGSPWPTSRSWPDPSGDWRLAFTLSGLAVAAVWVVWTLLAPGEPRVAAASGARAALVVALRERNTWLLALCHMCGFGMAIVLGTWVTLYLADAFGLPIAAAGADRLADARRPASSPAPRVASSWRAGCDRSG